MNFFFFLGLFRHILSCTRPTESTETLNSHHFFPGGRMGTPLQDFRELIGFVGAGLAPALY
jgi:hypothetical protein